jgi:hypothetical protein
MHHNPTISYDLARARIAELHRQADRDALAHAARRARRDAVSTAPSRRAAGGLAPRLRTVLVTAADDLRRRLLAAPGRPTQEQQP